MKAILRVVSSVVLLSLFITTTVPASAEDARTVMQKMEQEQAERWAKVKSYVVTKDSVGTRSVLLYEKIIGDNALGFRIVPPAEISQRHPDTNIGLNSGHVLAVESMLQNLPPVTVGGVTVDLDPAAINNFTDAFGTAVASSNRQFNSSKAEQEAIQAAGDRDLFKNKAKWIGIESVGSRSAHHLRADDVNMTQTTKDGSYTLKTAELFVDKEMYVPLKMRFDFTEDKTGRKFTVEKISSDYRQVSSLYEPFKEIMRIKPEVGSKQAKELEKAQREMAKVKAQLAAMPPEQRAMMEQMMGSQMQGMMKTVDNMAEGKGIEVESVVKSFVAFDTAEKGILHYPIALKRSGMTPARPVQNSPGQN